MADDGRDPFREADLRQLRERGIGVEEARRQLTLLRRPPGYVHLERPCRLGDGIQAVEEQEVEPLLRLGAEAAGEGRCVKFVPASGAASRMFRDLLRYQRGAEPLDEERLSADERRERPGAAAVRRFLSHLADFPFAGDLDRVIGGGGGAPLLREGRYGEILDALLSDAGLGYGNLPKALLPFHRYREEVRTPFEEHLVEAAELVRDADGLCRLHFTISPAHEAAFRGALEGARRRQERRRDVRYRVDFSFQSPSTDTMAVDLEGRPFRDAEGRLLFRAAGHGALLDNLGALEAEIALIKNIDNVVPDRLKGPTVRWSRLIVGLLARLLRGQRELLRALEDGGGPATLDRAARFCREQLGSPVPEGGDRRSWLMDRLGRPARVCGMVPNEGEPGGGPFWVREAGEVSRQIVESAQVDPDSPEQRERFAAASHFHPVFMACGLRDHRGRRFDLRRFLDPEAVLVTRKSAAGRELRALERPGLWNGAMARWNTVFLEVPGVVFNPVKVVGDLLREAHRAA